MWECGMGDPGCEMGGQDMGSEMGNLGSRMQDPECGMWDPGCGIRDAGSGMQDLGCGIRDVGCGTQTAPVRDAGCGMRDPGRGTQTRSVREQCPLLPAALAPPGAAEGPMETPFIHHSCSERARLHFRDFPFPTPGPVLGMIPRHHRTQVPSPCRTP